MVKISVTAETPEEAARALQKLCGPAAFRVTEPKSDKEKLVDALRKYGLYGPDASSSERLVSRESELERLLIDLVKEMSDGIQSGRATDEQFKVFPSVASAAAYLAANRS